MVQGIYDSTLKLFKKKLVAKEKGSLLDPCSCDGALH